MWRKLMQKWNERLGQCKLINKIREYVNILQYTTTSQLGLTLKKYAQINWSYSELLLEKLNCPMIFSWNSQCGLSNPLGQKRLNYDVLIQNVLSVSKKTALNLKNVKLYLYDKWFWFVCLCYFFLKRLLYCKQ